MGRPFSLEHNHRTAEVTVDAYNKLHHLIEMRRIISLRAEAANIDIINGENAKGTVQRRD